MYGTTFVLQSPRSRFNDTKMTMKARPLKGQKSESEHLCGFLGEDFNLYLK